MPGLSSYFARPSGGRSFAHYPFCYPAAGALHVGNQEPPLPYEGQSP